MPVSSGRIVKARRKNTGAPHQKNHRWESFSSKISKLHSLDPLKKVRRHDLDNEDLAATTSYLRNGLERWTELAIATGFTSFRKEVMPLCDSLPQILHHQDTIMDLLERSISANEKESIEPFLDLLTAFAHDLGIRFDKYFPRALGLLVAIAGKAQDAEVIEWTFGSMAFLFKYLAKLLVPDLGPTYTTVAPLMGKARHPPHIARFAAEALSFLVKKTGSASNRVKSLPLIVSHAREDLYTMLDDRQYGLYYHGIMTMFAEALKGPGNALHSSAPEIFHALVAGIPDEEFDVENPSPWTDVVSGVLTSVIHHITVDTFKPMEDGIYQLIETWCQHDALPSSPWRLSVLTRILGLMAGVQRGTRIGDWPRLSKTLAQVLDATRLAESGAIFNHPSTWDHIVMNAAVVWHQCPLDSLIPLVRRFSTTMTREPLLRWFIPFCSYLSELNSARFRSLFQKEFQSFVGTHWSDDHNDNLLCVILPRMAASGALPTSGTAKDTFHLPQSWQADIETKFERLEISPFPERGAYGKDPKVWKDECLPKYSALLQVLSSTTARAPTNAKVAELLLRKLKLALRPSTSLATDEAVFIATNGFWAYLELSKPAGSIDSSLSPLLKAAAPRFCSLPPFIEAMTAYEAAIQTPKKDTQKPKDQSEGPPNEADPFLKCLIGNLTSPSQHLRLASLRLLEQLDTTPDQLDCLATMIQIEATPFDLQNARMITSVLMGRLTQSYRKLPAGSWLTLAIPSYLFGLLSAPLNPVSKQAIESLKLIGESKGAENIICDLCLDWMSKPPPRFDGPRGHFDRPRGRLTDFECTNMMGLRTTSAETKGIIQGPMDALLGQFEESQKIAELQPWNARLQAIQVLTALPSLAEKRSRVLVPFFLAWAGDADQPTEDDEEQEGISDGWTAVDKKALVGVFALFGNPRVLYQADKVYDALLGILQTGDIEMQKITLKAVLAWKQEEAKHYQESLENLLDDARFRDTLSVLFRGDDKIKPEHRDVLMPVLLRLLYGRSVAKKGIKSTPRALRKSIIRSLPVEDMGRFLDIVLGKLGDIVVVDSSGVRNSVWSTKMLHPRRQVGLLNMLEDLVKEMGPDIQPHNDKLIQTILYCLIPACRQIAEQGEEAHDDKDDNDEEGQSASHPVVYNIRRHGIRCLILLFQNAQAFNWDPFLGVLVKEVISPRVEKLAVETAQGVASLLQLLFTWASLPKVAMALSIDKRIMPGIAEILSLEKAKDDVKIYALDIIKSLIKLAVAPASESEFNELIRDEVLEPQLEDILVNVNGILENHTTIGRPLLEACIDFMIQAALVVRQSNSIHSLLDISVKILEQPPGVVSPKIKGTTLLVLERFIGVVRLEDQPKILERVYSITSCLFSYFKDAPNRNALSRVLKVFADQDPDVREISGLCSDLNSYAENQLDAPDYSRRLEAFAAIARQRPTPFTANQWLPILHNLMFFIKHDEEAGALSMNSADGLCRFVRDASRATYAQKSCPFRNIVINTLLVDIQKGAREPAEIAREGYLRVLHQLVKFMSSLEEVSDLKALLPVEDTEDPEAEVVMGPSIFSIYNLPRPGQLAVLERLEDTNRASELHSSNIGKFFIPLLEHTVFDRPEGVDDGGLGAAAASTIAELGCSLEWQQYRAVFQRFVSYIDKKPDVTKRTVRLIGKFSDALVSAAAAKESNVMDVDGREDELVVVRRRLANTMPPRDKLNEDMLFMSPLLEHLHEKDESTVSARVPVGITVVKLLQLLPEQSRNQRLPGVLIDICHILRSQAWESREMARNTLAQISKILGPSGFGYILKELQTALTKGHQLHVLSYTVHSLLLTVIPEFKQGDLDYCLSDLVVVVMDDVFGTIGEEKDEDGYVSKFKEVKSSKSQDTMQLVAKNASINHLIELVNPLQALLSEKLNIRVVRKVDELLTRITAGLLKNPAAESRDTLVFCYEVIQEVYNKQKPREEARMDPKVKRYLLQGGAKKLNRGKTSKYTFKIVRFALDILRTVFKKHDSLRVGENIEGFLSVFKDAVVGGEEEVQISTFKLLIAIVKVPFKDNASDDVYMAAIKEAARSISMSQSTGSDLSQASLKLVAVVLRDRRNLRVSDAIVDSILKKLKDDLTEPLSRHISFNFLRCVLDRQVETAVVYDTLDHVGNVMITNDDRDTRDLARGAFFQFLQAYPQKRSRWEKQLQFIVANLGYDREGGRISVMEVIHLLLMKSADNFVQEVAATCFAPLLLVVANDDSEKCRLAAGELIKEIFRKANKDQLGDLMVFPRSGLQQTKNKDVCALALHTFGLYFEARDPAPKDKKDVSLALQRTSEVLAAPEGESSGDMVDNSLKLLRTLAHKYPTQAFGPETKPQWSSVFACLSSPNESIKLSSMQLLGVYLVDFAQNTKGEAAELPVEGSYGLTLDGDDATALVRHCCYVLRSLDVTETLAQEGAKVLLFLSTFLSFGKRDSKTDVEGSEGSGAEGSEDEDEDREADKESNEISGDYILVQLTKVLRREVPTKAGYLVSKMAAMELLAALCKNLDKESLDSTIQTILAPLQNFTDPSIPAPFSAESLFTTRYEELQEKSGMIMRGLHDKFGTTEYTKQLLAVREVVRGKRHARASKRKIGQLVDPEKYGKEKRKKYVKEKARRKAKGGKYKAKRHGAY